jgi:hypothetical protein
VDDVDRMLLATVSSEEFTHDAMGLYEGFARKVGLPCWATSRGTGMQGGAR